MAATQTSTYIRWMIRRDMPEVLAIESEAFREYCWTEADFIDCLRQRNCIGMVAERNERVVGYMLYELHRTHIYILNFAVHCDFRLTGVGRAMVDKLINKLSPQRRSRIVANVNETNLDAQLFFKACGFLAIAVKPQFYEDSWLDAYTFEYVERT